MVKKRIDSELLIKLIEEYKIDHSNSKQMGNKLGRILISLVESVLWSPKWKGYSDNWKADMQGKAYIRLVSYMHKFDQQKIIGDPTNYFITIIHNSFKEEVKILKTNHETFTIEDVEYSDVIDIEKNECWSAEEYNTYSEKSLLEYSDLIEKFLYDNPTAKNVFLVGLNEAWNNATNKRSVCSEWVMKQKKILSARKDLEQILREYIIKQNLQ